MSYTVTLILGQESADDIAELINREQRLGYTVLVDGEAVRDYVGTRREAARADRFFLWVYYGGSTHMASRFRPGATITVQVEDDQLTTKEAPSE